jgi:hypothetical protein
MELGHSIRLDVISVEHIHPSTKLYNISTKTTSIKEMTVILHLYDKFNYCVFSGFAMETYLKQSWMQSTTPIIFISTYNYPTGNLFVSL